LAAEVRVEDLGAWLEGPFSYEVHQAGLTPS
jgi:hypothetical protein